MAGARTQDPKETSYLRGWTSKIRCPFGFSHVISITGDPDDPMRSKNISLTWAREQIASYGRDNPWVMVNVFGEFPPESINALLGVEDVEKAMKRKIAPENYLHSQKRIGIDVARFGDDRTVIFPRQGRMSWRPIVMRNAKTTQISARAAAVATKWHAELIMVDDTFQWGKGVLDQLGDAGFACVQEEAIGMLGLYTMEHPFTGERMAEELAWWVEPEHRGGRAGQESGPRPSKTSRAS